MVPKYTIPELEQVTSLELSFSKPAGVLTSRKMEVDLTSLPSSKMADQTL